MRPLKKTKIGERLKIVRGKLTQKDFSKILKVSYWSYIRQENGERLPSLELLFKIEKRYRINIDWILTGEGDMIKGFLLTDENRKEILNLYERLCLHCFIGNYYDSTLQVVPLSPSNRSTRKDSNDLILLCPNCKSMYDQGYINFYMMKAKQIFWFANRARKTEAVK